MRSITFAVLFLLTGTVAAFASCEAIGGRTARDGVCEIPRSVYAQATAWQRATAKAWAAANGVRWRIVNR